MKFNSWDEVDAVVAEAERQVVPNEQPAKAPKADEAQKKLPAAQSGKKSQLTPNERNLAIGRGEDVEPLPTAVELPSSWDEAFAEVEEVESGFDPEYLKELENSERVAQMLVSAAPFGAAEWAAAAKVPPEHRRAVLERAAELFKERGPMKDASEVTRSAVAFAQGSVDMAIPVADFFAPEELQLTPEQEAFRQALLGVREGEDPSLSDNSFMSALQTGLRITPGMAMMGQAGRVAGTLGQAAGLGQRGMQIAQGAGVTAAAYPMAQDQTYKSLITEGVDADTAKYAARVSGVLEGVIESIIPDPFKVKGGALKGTLRRKAIEAAKRAGTFTGRLGMEAGEEGAQALVRELILEVARAVDEEVPNKGLDQAFVKAAEEAVGSIGPLGFAMGVPGLAGGAKAIADTRARAKGYQDAIEKRDYARYRRELAKSQDQAQTSELTPEIRRLQRLQEIRGKGFVSKEEADEMGTGGKTRKERMANVNKAIKDGLKAIEQKPTPPPLPGKPQKPTPPPLPGKPQKPTPPPLPGKPPLPQDSTSPPLSQEPSDETQVQEDEQDEQGQEGQGSPEAQGETEVQVTKTAKTPDGYTFYKQPDGRWTDSADPEQSDMAFDSLEDLFAEGASVEGPAHQMTAHEYVMSRVADDENVAARERAREFLTETPADTPFSPDDPIETYRLAHKRAVQTAIKYGAEVPAEVLSDYPDLSPIGHKTDTGKGQGAVSGDFGSVPTGDKAEAGREQPRPEDWKLNDRVLIPGDADSPKAVGQIRGAKIGSDTVRVEVDGGGSREVKREDLRLPDAKFEVDEKVLVPWAKGKDNAPATIKEVLPDGTYRVLFASGRLATHSPDQLIKLEDSTSGARIKPSQPSLKQQAEAKTRLKAVPAFKGASIVSDEKNGTIKVALPDGLATTVHLNADERLKAATKSRGSDVFSQYARKPGAKHGDIYIRSDADHTNILNREVINWLEDTGVVSKEEVDRYGGREAIAEKYSRWEGLRSSDKVFKKIFGAVEALLSSRRGPPSSANEGPEQPSGNVVAPEEKKPAEGSLSVDDFAELFANPDKSDAPSDPRDATEKNPPPKKPSPPRESSPRSRKPAAEKKASNGVEEGIQEAKDGAALIRKGLKDLGNTSFTGPPINADIARGLGMMANGLIKAGKYKFSEFVEAAVEMLGESSVRYLGPYLEAGWNKKSEADDRLDKAGKVLDILSSKKDQPKDTDDSFSARADLLLDLKERADKAIGKVYQWEEDGKGDISQIEDELDDIDEKINRASGGLFDINSIAEAGTKESIEKKLAAKAKQRAHLNARKEAARKKEEELLKAREEQREAERRAEQEEADKKRQETQDLIDRLSGKDDRKATWDRDRVEQMRLLKEQNPSEFSKYITKASELAYVLDNYDLTKNKYTGGGSNWSARRKNSEVKEYTLSVGDTKNDAIFHISSRADQAVVASYSKLRGKKLPELPQQPSQLSEGTGGEDFISSSRKLAIEKLKKHGLKIDPIGDRWVVSGKTFKVLGKTGIGKDLGGRFDGERKTWSFETDPTDAIAARIPDEGDGKQPTDGGDSDANVERRRVREREAERPDERTTGESALELVGEDTKKLIQRGVNFGIPESVLDGQAEDIGRVTHAFESGKPMFLVGSAPGMGKSFVLGGSIAEIRKRIKKKGEKPRFIYVTENQELIRQLQKDLSDYGVSDVEFVTYAGVRNKTPNAAGAIVLIDEAHNAKNLQTKSGKSIQAMVESSDFTVYATATPFENVAEAKYLEASGVFDGVEATVKRTDERGKTDYVQIDGFDAWAFAYGAEMYWPKKSPRPVIYWHKHTTAEEGQIQANDWLASRGVYTQRPMVLPADMVSSDLRAVTVDDSYSKMFSNVLGAYADAEANVENGLDAGMIRAHGINLQKRILEASKVKHGIARAKELIAEGKQVVIFVNTKADRAVGKYALSASYRKHHGIKGERAKKLYSPVEMADMMLEYQRSKRMAGRFGEKVGPAPFAKSVFAISQAMERRGVDFSLPSIADELLNAFPDGQSVEYTGRLTDAKAKENLAQWKSGKAKVIVATMDKGGTGLSYHDTTGKAPERVQVNINLPWSGTQVEQVSGRLARLGTAKPVSLEWIFAENIQFERDLSKTVGSRMRSMQAAVQGTRGDMAQSIKDFEFGDAPVTQVSPTESSESLSEDPGAEEPSPPEKSRVEQIKDTFGLTDEQAIVADILFDVAKIPGEIEIAQPGTPIPSDESKPLFQKTNKQLSALKQAEKKHKEERYAQKKQQETIALRLAEKSIREQLKEFKDTPFARVARNDLAFQREIALLVDKLSTMKTAKERKSWIDDNSAKLPLISKPAEGKDNSKSLREDLIKDPIEGAWKYLEARDSGALTFNAKADLAVNSGMRNCNPSKGCAKHCYVASGRLGMHASQAKSALMDLLARRDPKRMATQIVNDYKATDNYANGLMLRFFDKGEFDGNTAEESAWFKVIEEVNRQGIPVQVFSKKPQILEKLDPRNVRLLSVDSSMMYDETNAEDVGKKLPKSKWHPALAWAMDKRSTVSLAVTYQGIDAPGELEFMEMLAPVLLEQKGVILPVTLARGRRLGFDELGITRLPKGLKAHFCEVASGYGRDVPQARKTLGQSVDMGPHEMQCTTCNSNAKGLGCFFKQQAHAKFQSMQKDAGLSASETINPEEIVSFRERVIASNEYTEEAKAELLKSLAAIEKLVVPAKRVYAIGATGSQRSQGDTEGSGSQVGKGGREGGTGVGPTKSIQTTQTQYGNEFSTGKPVTFSFRRNTESATGIFGKPKKGDRYGRDKEPSGEYMILYKDSSDPDLPGIVSGTRTFQNPLVIKEDGWKKNLSEAYGGKTGKELSLAIIEDGYDGIVTASEGNVSEIVDLTTFDESKALYQRAGSVDPDSIPVAVLYKMSRKLKSMGYDSRGAEDVRRAIKERNLLDYHEDWIEAYDTAVGSEQSRKSKSIAKKDLKNVDWARLRELGTTTDPNEAGYIKPDGTFADLSGKQEGGQPGMRSYDHREAGGTGGMQEVMAFGWIRMDENAGSVDIAKQPTAKQLSSIVRMAERHDGELVVDLEDGLGEYRPSDEYYAPSNRRWSKEYPRGTNPRRIANDIKKFFSGETPNTLRQQQSDQDGTIQAWTQTIVSASKAIIGATDKKDVSSFFHEFGHPMRRLLFNRSVPQEKRGNITDEDIRVIEDFVGVKNGKWTRENEEKFVDANMSYWMEGKAPTEKLEAVFKKIAAWLSDVLSVVQRKVDLTPEVRAIFDKVYQRGEVSPEKLKALELSSSKEPSAEPNSLLDDELDDFFGDIAPSSDRVNALAKIEAAGIKVKQTPRGWVATGISENIPEDVRGSALQDIEESLRSEGARKTSSGGYFFKDNPTTKLVLVAEAIDEVNREAEEAESQGLVLTPIGAIPSEDAEWYRSNKKARLEAATEELRQVNFAVEELLSQFVPKKDRGLFKVRLLEAAEKSDPNSIAGFDKLVDYSKEHPELALPTEEDGLFQYLLKAATEEQELSGRIDDELAEELEARVESEDDSFDFGANVEKKERQTAIEGFEEDVARQESKERFQAKRDKARSEIEETRGKQTAFLTDIYGDPSQGELFDADGIADEDISDDTLFQSSESPERLAARTLRSAIESGVTTFDGYVAHVQDQLRSDQVLQNASVFEAAWSKLRKRDGFGHLGPVGRVADIVSIEPSGPSKKPSKKQSVKPVASTPDRSGPRVAGVRTAQAPFPDRQVAREPYTNHELTGIAKAVMNDLREIGGLPELQAAPPETIEQWALDAQSVILADPHAPTRLMNEIISNPARALDHRDAMLLAFRYRELANQAEPHFQELVDANKSGDAERIAKARTNYINARQPMTEFEELTLKAKSTWGRTGVAIQVMLRKDNTVAGLMRRAREANHGKLLTPEQEMEMRDLAKRFAEVQKKLDEETVRADKAEAELASRKHFKQTVKTKTPTTRKKPSSKQRTKLDSVWREIADLENLDLLFQDGANPYINVVNLYRDLGVDTFAELLRHVKERVGIEQANRLEGQFRDAWESTKPKTEVRPNIDNGDMLSMTREARRIERSIVDSLLLDHSPEAVLEMRDKIIDAVHVEMQEILGDTFTRRQTMDALSAYGQFSRPSQSTVDKLLRNLNSEVLKVRQIEQLEDAVARTEELRAEGKTDEEISEILIDEDLLVAPTGFQRDTPTDRLRELNRQYNELKKEIPASSEGREGLLQTAIAAIERGLANRIHDLNQAIENKEPIKIGRKASPTNPKIEQMKLERDALLKQYREMFPQAKRKLTQEQRLANAIKAAERSISIIEKQLETQNFDKQAREPLPDSPELKTLRQRLEQLRAQREAAKALELSRWEGEGGSVGADPKEAAYRKAYIASLKNRIAKLQQFLSDGDFSTKPKKPPRTLSKQELILKKELAQLNTEKLRKMAEYHLSQLKGVPWVADKISEALHLARAIETSLDLSALGRQGGLIALGHPGLAKNALVAVVQSMAQSFDKSAMLNRNDFKPSEIEQFLTGIDSQEAELAFMHQLTEGEWGEYRQLAGLDLPSTDQAITRQEEVFQGRWGKFVPGVGVSSRLYTMILNKMRADMFDLMVEKLGRQGKPSLEEAKMIADFVNVMTGRSSAIVWKGRDVTAMLNLAFFAPRYVASRFQYLAMPFYLPFKGGLKTNLQVKKAIAKEYARSASGASLVLGLIAMSGMLFWDDEDEDKPTVGADPTTSDFLKVKIGDTRLDFLAGLQQIFVLSSRMSPSWMGGARIGDKKFGEGGPYAQNRLTVAARFARTKLAPGPGFAVTAANDWENVVGEKSDRVFGVKVHPAIGTIGEMFLPLSIRDINETFKSQPIPVASGASILSILGVGMSTYGDKTDYITGSKEDRQEQIKNDLDQLEWNSKPPVYAEYLTENQLAKFEQVKHDRFGKKIYDATGEPSSENAIKLRDQAIAEIKASGYTYEEARQALYDYWQSPLRNKDFRKKYLGGEASLEDYEGKTNRITQGGELKSTVRARVRLLNKILNKN